MYNFTKLDIKNYLMDRLPENKYSGSNYINDLENAINEIDETLELDYFTDGEVEQQNQDYGDSYFSERKIGALYFFDGEVCCDEYTVCNWLQVTEERSKHDNLFSDEIIDEIKYRIALDAFAAEEN